MSASVSPSPVKVMRIFHSRWAYGAALCAGTKLSPTTSTENSAITPPGARRAAAADKSSTTNARLIGLVPGGRATWFRCCPAAYIVDATALPSYTLLLARDDQGMPR